MLYDLISGKKCSRDMPLDLLIVMDKTRSLSKPNFVKLKDFVTLFVDQFTVSEDETHMSIITYAGEPLVVNQLNEVKYHSNAAMKELVQSIPVKLNSPTRTDKAMEAGRDIVFTAQHGDRPGFQNVMVVLTDGGTKMPESTPYEDITPGLDVSTITLRVG